MKYFDFRDTIKIACAYKERGVPVMCPEDESLVMRVPVDANHPGHATIRCPECGREFPISLNHRAINPEYRRPYVVRCHEIVVVLILYFTGTEP